jgi:serine phosphatase RsbU (regulator of sigma subunit)
MPFVQLSGPNDSAPSSLAWQAENSQGEAVGGDALFLEVGRADGRWMVLLADATGHGPAAAEVVAHLADLLLHDSDNRGLQPAALLRRLHAGMAPVSANLCRFAEAVALLIDPNGRALRAATAGAIRPYLADGPGAAWVEWDLPAPRMWLGVGDPTEVLPGEAAVTLAEGGRVLTFTDGVADMLHTTGQGPVQDFLAGLSAGLAPADLLCQLFQALRQLDLTTWAVDDTTACCWQA